MNRMIACCGITCTDCIAFMATQENDDTKRKEIAERWDIKPDDVNCDGCQDPEGRHIPYWVTCEIRNCGIEKNVENCAYCVEYSCEKLDKFHERSPQAKQTLDELRTKATEK